MKKVVANYVNSLGGTTNYSGNTKTMYINQPENWDDIDTIDIVILKAFGFLPFKLVTNNN